MKILSHPKMLLWKSSLAAEDLGHRATPMLIVAQGFSALMWEHRVAFEKGSSSNKQVLSKLKTNIKEYLLYEMIMSTCI